VVPQRDEAAPVVVAGQVQDDRAQVGRGLALVLDAAGRAGQADEALLHEILGRVAVVHEQAHEADQALPLLLEQPGDQGVDVDGGDDRRRGALDRGTEVHEDVVHREDARRGHRPDGRRDRRSRVTGGCECLGDAPADDRGGRRVGPA
jgi:hypothetical protein